MNFDFTEEQELFRKRLREGIERVIKPGYMERWPHDEFNYAVLKDLKELDLLGFSVPEEYGGQGYSLSAVETGIILEEMGRCDQSYTTIWGGLNNCCEMLMALCDDKELLDEWIPALCAGEKFVGYGFVEPGTGTDLSNIQTRGIKDGDCWIINGAKASVSFCNVDAHIVAVRTNEQKGSRGVTLFLIPDDLEGVEHFIYTDFGLKQIGRGDLAFKNVRVPERYMLGAEGQGFKNIMHIFDHGRPGIALQCIGAAESVMEECYEYCKQREVFGQPLSKYEAISFGLAEHQTKLDAAKLLAYKAMWLRDQNRWNAKEAGQAKFFGCEAAFDAIWFATRCFGHLGYTTDYPALNKLADTIGFAWGDGSWEACKMVAIREIAGPEFLPYERRNKDVSYKVMSGFQKV